MDLSIRTLNGELATLSRETVNELKTQLTGNLVLQADSDYDRIRVVWNAMIDRKPALIARCMGTADVVSCVRFARKHNLLVSVRGGGHNIAGLSLADGAFLIDLSAMKWVYVNPEDKTALAAPGATLREVDHETQVHGLAVPLGINSTTGISGLTLGGGFGWLSRKFGLTIDNLVSAEVVTADGKIVIANEKENPDLFWALRGGSGNFGIVTAFQFQLHHVGPQVLAGLIVHPFEDASNVLRHYRNFVTNAPDKATSWVILRKAPPLPFLAEEFHGKEVLVIAVMYSGEIDEGEQIFEPLRSFGKPLADIIGPVPLAAWQQAFDPLLTPGARNYWKSHNFYDLPDKFLDIIIEETVKLPSPMSEIFIAQLGGAINRKGNEVTAYPHRGINFVMNVHARWEDPSMDKTCIDWSKQFFEKTAPYSTGGVYVNFISEGENRVTSAFGTNYERLAEIKMKYDPDNFFCINQNISPINNKIFQQMITESN